MGEAQALKKYGVWFGPEQVPPNDFDEVLTDDSDASSFVGDAQLPGGVDRWKVLSDIGRIQHATKRTGWLYHDFDCKVWSLPQLTRTAFARHGIHTIDFFLYYVGEMWPFEKILEQTRRCLKSGLHRATVHMIVNKELLGKVDVIGRKHFQHPVNN